jgi:hypothetical protein
MGGIGSGFHPALSNPPEAHVAVHHKTNYRSENQEVNSFLCGAQKRFF